MISFDTGLDLGVAVGTSLTISYTNSGDILFVGGLSTAAGDVITGVTYNGVALTKISAVQEPANAYITFWYLIAPATGAHDIVVTANTSGTMVGDAASYFATTPNIDATGTNTATATTSIAATITTTKNNAWTIAWCGSDGFTISAGASTTLRQGNGVNRAILDSNAGITPAGSTTLNASMSGSGNSAIIMTSFYEPAAVSGASFLLSMI